MKKLVKKFKKSVEWFRGQIVYLCLVLCNWLMTVANTVAVDYSKKKKKKKKK